MAAINSGKTRHHYVGSCVRQLWLETAMNGFYLRAIHLPGVENRIADSLSRWDLSPLYETRFWDAVRGQHLMERLIDLKLFSLNENI